jgi:hypothetical protein
MGALSTTFGVVESEMMIYLGMFLSMWFNNIKMDVKQIGIYFEASTGFKWVIVRANDLLLC